MDAADRAELVNQIAEARADGHRARNDGRDQHDCPYVDDQLQSAWLEGWAEQDRNVNAL